MIYSIILVFDLVGVFVVVLFFVCLVWVFFVSFFCCYDKGNQIDKMLERKQENAKSRFTGDYQ